MKWSYVWPVVGGLLKLALAAAVLFAFDGRFERAVMSLLVLIYSSMESYAIQQGLVTVEQAKLGQTRFLKIMQTLGSTEFEDEGAKHSMKEEQERIERNVTKGYIRIGFISPIVLLAVWSLLNSL